MYAVSQPLQQIHDPALASIVARLGCSIETAKTVHQAVKNLMQRGSVGARPFGSQRGFNVAAFVEEASHPMYKGVDPHELGSVLRAAWLEGIQAVDRITVELHSDTCDAECRECGETIPNGSEECPVCEGDDIKHFVEVVVEGPFAALWAEVEPFVLGKAWETEGDDYAYFKIAASEDLVEDLEDEFGFKLDTSNYEEA